MAGNKNDNEEPGNLLKVRLDRRRLGRLLLKSSNVLT